MKNNRLEGAARRATGLGVIVFAGLGGGCAQTATSVEPTPSVTPEQPQEVPPIVKAIDKKMPGWMESFHVPGVSIVGIEDRRIAWDRHYGVRRAGDTTKVDRNTVFEACSLSKPVFAYPVLKLVERGKLDLDRPLVGYLKEPYLPDEPLHKKITARMVLSHTSGFPNWRKGASGKLPVGFEPGTRFEYSGEGFLYLQRVVEQITGVPAEKWMRQELFDPLGITISSYVWENRFREFAAAGHDAKGRPKPGRPLYRRANVSFSLYCTAHEYAKVLVEILKQDRSADHSLSARSVDAMLTRTSEATGRKAIERGGRRESDAVHWGLGWAINKTAGGDRFYHTGSNGTGFRCYCEFDVERGIGLVVMTNAEGGTRLWRRLVETFAEP